MLLLDHEPLEVRPDAQARWYCCDSADLCRPMYIVVTGIHVQHWPATAAGVLASVLPSWMPNSGQQIICVLNSTSAVIQVNWAAAAACVGGHSSEISVFGDNGGFFIFCYCCWFSYVSASFYHSMHILSDFFSHCVAYSHVVTTMFGFQWIQLTKPNSTASCNYVVVYIGSAAVNTDLVADFWLGG